MAKRKRTKRRFIGSLWGTILGGTFFLLSLIGGVAAGIYATVMQTVPNATYLHKYQPEQTTKIFSSDGQLLASLYEENREVVPIEEIPQDLINATIAIEDDRFFEHCGISPRAIFRALRANLLARRPVQGGSTITQQLARDVYLSRQKTLMRKLQEALLALRIERLYSKEEILGLYLNQICYGHGAYGVAAAAQVYFGKKVQDLNLAECALLAGLPRWPVGYSPYNYPQRAKQRRAVVLNRMVELGYITPRQAEEAKKEPLPTDVSRLKRAGVHHFRAPYFVTYVIRQLVKRYGEDTVYKGGLRVYTTLNIPLQIGADKALKVQLREARSRNVTQGAVVCIDPRTGYILALVGGRDFNDPHGGQWNRATQARRPPGSAFKPFVYTVAIDQGWSPHDVLSATPTTFWDQFGKPYRPKNYNSKQVGPYTLENALAQSVNVVAVRLIEKVGPHRVVEYAHRMGIKQRLYPYLSLALGSRGVTPLEMAVAYCPFANGGLRVEPISILRIEDSQGNLIYRARPHLRRVLSERTAYIMREMLRGVILHGTGRRAARLNLPAAGKTGTTTDDRDAWFIGFTPGLVTAVWVGNDDNSPMRHTWGGNTCVPIWMKVTKAAAELFEWPEDFPRPLQFVQYAQSPQEKDEDTAEETETVTVCALTGLPATEQCPSTRLQKFPAGAVPQQFCKVHQGPRPLVPPPPPAVAQPQPALASVPSSLSPATPSAPKSEPQIPVAPPPPKPTETPSPPPAPPPSPPELQAVVICTSSGQRATEYCPQTVVINVPPDEVPSSYCSQHGPRGE